MQVKPRNRNPVPLSGSLPDVTKTQPVRAFRSATCLALLVKDAKSIAASSGLCASIIAYPYTFVVLDHQSKAPILFITLEKSAFGARCYLGIFDESGGHATLGHDDALQDEHEFVRRAIELTKSTFGEDLDELHSPDEKVAKLQNAARHNDAEAQYQLGMLLRQRNSQQEYDEALRLLRLAARQGHYGARLALETDAPRNAVAKWLFLRGGVLDAVRKGVVKAGLS